MPLLFPIESEESLDEGVHEPGDRRYDLLHALAPLAAAQEQDLEFVTHLGIHQFVVGFLTFSVM